MEMETSVEPSVRHAVSGPLAKLRAPQRDALKAFADNNRRGIVVLPCGVGKTAVIMHAICQADAWKTLIVTANTQTATQMKRDIVTNTSMCEDLIFLVTGKEKRDGFRHATEAIVITTYTLFASTATGRGAAVTQEFFTNITETRWDFVALDEVHVAPAPAFRQFVRSVIHAREEQPPCILALTATLFREHRTHSGEVVGEEADDELTQQDFAFIGEPIYRAKWADVQKQGIIAKMRFVRVTCPIDSESREAIELLNANKAEDAALAAAPSRSKASRDKANRDIKNDVYSLTPSKIEVAVAIARYHHYCLQQQVLIFVEAKVIVQIIRSLGVENILVPGYIILDGKSTEAERQEAVDRIEDGSCPGVVMTSIGETGLNLTSSKLGAVVKLNGPPKSRCRDAQRTGRVTRTFDGGGPDGETDEEAVARRRKQQKDAFVYDLVTADSTEQAGAEYRESQLLVKEGYTLDASADGDNEFQILHHTSTYVRDLCNECLPAAEHRVELSLSQRSAVVDAMVRRKEENSILRAQEQARACVRQRYGEKRQKYLSDLDKIKSSIMKERKMRQKASVLRQMDVECEIAIEAAVAAVRSQMSTTTEAPVLAVGGSGL